jgi:L-threonylcarbamoyladenylate synthase
MERITLTSENTEEAAQKAAEVLRAGGVILYPTDTLYALGAAYGEEEKVYAIKNRDPQKKLSYIVSDIDAASPYAAVTPLAQTLSDRLFPGKLTIILSETFSARVPANALCLLLADLFGKPYTATSANIAGHEPQRSLDAVLAQLGDNAKNIDLVIDAGELQESKPSTVVDARGEKPIILREGAISAEQILA